MKAKADRNHLIASAAATLEILELLGAAREPLPLSVIVDRCGKPKGTVHRMLATLVNTGYAGQDPSTSKYSVTLKLWRLGVGAVAGLDIVKTAKPWLEQLVLATDETVHLACFDPSGGVIYVSKIESLRSIRVQTQIGQLSPSWCTATGRALLAFNPSVAERVLARPLVRRTPKTIVDPKRIRSLLVEIATRGYSITRSENHPEMGGIAAPVRDHTGSVVASCGVAIPVFRMTKQLIDQCIPHVLHASTNLSTDLGFRP